MKFILGRKLEMTQIWVGEERRAVTKVEVGPCTVLQVKTKTNDGYAAVQLGYGQKSVKRINQPEKGHMKNLGNFRWLREFRLDKPGMKNVPEVSVGDTIAAGTFAEGDKLTVVGTVKGRGFAGVVKRHGFHGHNATHGTKDQERMPGSIGAGGVQHVFKGKRMAGRMGGNQVTFKGFPVLGVDEANGILLIGGAIPGSRGSLVKILADGELKIASVQAQAVATEPVEPVVTEAEVVAETPVVTEAAAE
jgi:large subunit ribosomal protein L3